MAPSRMAESRDEREKEREGEGDRAPARFVPFRGLRLLRRPATATVRVRLEDERKKERETRERK